VGAKPLFPPRSREAAQQELAHTLQVAPPQGGRWSLARLRQTIAWLSGYTLSCVWNTLQRCGVVYKRGREYLHSPDPDYALKMSLIEAAKQQVSAAPERVVLLYQDELTYYRRPTLARAYAARGSKEPKAGLGYRRNHKRRIAGSLNGRTGQFHPQHSAQCGVSQLKSYYQQLEAAYPDAATIYLAQDNWPVHRHPDLLLYFLTSRIVPLWLPTYAPWTNPCEKVWLRLKQELLHLHPFQDDWLALQAAVQAWLDQWHSPSPDLLHYVGLSPY
jgi:transposase